MAVFNSTLVVTGVVLLALSMLIVKTKGLQLDFFCFSSDSQNSCQDRGLYFSENVRMGGRCPGCISLAGEGEPCLSIGCSPGYKCNGTIDDPFSICVEDSTQVCALAKLKAEKVPGSWIPECTPDGMYAMKQCKGEPMSGKCFCFDPDGKRIFGEEIWSLAANMTCGCSRLVWDLQRIRSDVTIHCNAKGNFEEVQCDQGVCWCARESDGRPYSSVVADKMMKALPCYDSSKHGDQYLRKCDSIMTAQQKTGEILKIHGTESIAFSSVSCNYDGSYSRVQLTNSGKICVSKDNTQIWDFIIERNTETTCNCAYDKYVSEGEFNLVCDQDANYKPMQYAGGVPFCVDQDGFNKPC